MARSVRNSGDPEGEAQGRKLRQAGVDVTAVRYEGVFHDFMMLNALADECKS